MQGSRAAAGEDVDLMGNLAWQGAFPGLAVVLAVDAAELPGAGVG